MEEKELDNNLNQDTDKKRKKSKKVCWDEVKLAEQEMDKKLQPKMKIDEPKTPFNALDDDENDPYLKVLKEVNSKKADVSSITYNSN